MARWSSLINATRCAPFHHCTAKLAAQKVAFARSIPYDMLAEHMSRNGAREARDMGVFQNDAEAEYGGWAIRDCN